jgi:hypothetical protein
MAAAEGGANKGDEGGASKSEEEENGEDAQRTHHDG